MQFPWGIIMADSRLSQFRYGVAFQSRLGRQEWIKPYLEPKVVELAKGGVKNLTVACPSFVSDCLETLEEVGLSIRETFLENGGASFQLVPCLNDAEVWVQSLSNELLKVKR